MKKLVVTEETLRSLVREALDDSVTGAIYAPEPKGGAKVNSVVDPSAAVTDPMNPDYRPQNSVELGVAIKQMTDDMADDQASRIYDMVKQSIDAEMPDDEKKDPVPDNHPEQEDDDMKDDNSGTKSGTHSGTTAESIVREAIRDLIVEEFEDYDRAVAGEDDDDVKKPVEKKKKEPDDTFAALAKDLGMAVSGAKQFVEKALARWKFLQQELPKGHPNTAGPRLGKDRMGREYTDLNDMEVLILKAWADYIEFLVQTDDEITKADIQLMHDHPEVALELDGFREFVHHYVDNALVPTDEKGGEWSGSDPLSGKVRTRQNAPAYKGHYDWLEDDVADSSSEYSRVKRKAANRVARSVEGGPGEE